MSELQAEVENPVAVAKYDVTTEVINKLSAEVKNIVIQNDKDYSAADELRKKAKKLRCDVENRRKKINAPWEKDIKDNNAEAKSLIALLEPIEIEAEKKLKAVDDEKARLAKEEEERKLKLAKERISQLVSIGFTFDGMQYVSRDHEASITVQELRESVGFEDFIAPEIEKDLAFKAEKERERKELEEGRLYNERLSLLNRWDFKGEIEREELIGLNDAAWKKMLANAQLEAVKRMAKPEPAIEGFKISETLPEGTTFSEKPSYVVTIGKPVWDIGIVQGIQPDIKERVVKYMNGYVKQAPNSGDPVAQPILEQFCKEIELTVNKFVGFICEK